MLVGTGQGGPFGGVGQGILFTWVGGRAKRVVTGISGLHYYETALGQRHTSVTQVSGLGSQGTVFDDV